MPQLRRALRKLADTLRETHHRFIQRTAVQQLARGVRGLAQLQSLRATIRAHAGEETMSCVGVHYSTGESAHTESTTERIDEQSSVA